jgi:hypothetical protein
MGGLFPGASGGIQDILKQLQAAQNQANQANQQRYKDVLGMYSNLGQSGAQQIQQQTAQQQAQSTQDLTSRGLGNTTITGAMSRGINQAGQQNLLGLQEGLAGQEAGVMERMTQQGPDLSMYANLIKGAMSKPQQQMPGGNIGNPIGAGRYFGGGTSNGSDITPPNQGQFFPAGSLTGGNGWNLAPTGGGQSQDEYDWLTGGD